MCPGGTLQAEAGGWDAIGTSGRAGRGSPGERCLTCAPLASAKGLVSLSSHL